MLVLELESPEESLIRTAKSTDRHSYRSRKHSHTIFIDTLHQCVRPLAVTERCVVRYSEPRSAYKPKLFRGAAYLDNTRPIPEFRPEKHIGIVE